MKGTGRRMGVGGATVVAVLSVLASGCSAGPTEAGFEFSELVGQWEWVSSTGGLAGWTLTPGSTGETRALRFRTDGFVEWLVDSEVTLTQSFSVATGEAGGQFPGRQVLVLDGNEEVGLSTLGDDGLMLDEGCCDRFVHEYSR